MNAVIPVGTRCDRCIGAAQVRVTFYSVMLPLFFCSHHEREFFGDGVVVDCALEYEEAVA